MTACIKHRTLISTLVVAGIILATPLYVSAQAPNLKDLSVPIVPGSDIYTVLGRILNTFLLLTGIAAFLFVLYGGFLYLTAGGDTNRTQQGQRTILNAVIGIVIIFLSYALVSYITSQLKKNTTSKTSSGNTTQNSSTQTNTQSGTTGGATTGSNNQASSSTQQAQSTTAQGTTIQGRAFIPGIVGPLSQGLDVSLKNPTTGDAVAFAGTDLSGSWSIDGVSAGTYTISITGPDISDTTYWCLSYSRTFDGKSKYIENNTLTECLENFVAPQTTAGDGGSNETEEAFVAPNSTASQPTPTPAPKKSIAQRTSEATRKFVGTVFDSIVGLFKKKPKSVQTDVNIDSQQVPAELQDNIPQSCTTNTFC